MRYYLVIGHCDGYENTGVVIRATCGEDAETQFVAMLREDAEETGSPDTDIYVESVWDCGDHIPTCVR